RAEVARAPDAPRRVALELREALGSTRRPVSSPRRAEPVGAPLLWSLRSALAFGSRARALPVPTVVADPPRPPWAPLASPRTPAARADSFLESTSTSSQSPRAADN